MKKILLSSFIAASLLTGCSAVYQSGQTPDDLYYATGKAITKTEVKQEDEERYEENVRTADDRYLRMKVSNRNQWGSIDNFSYWNDMRYSFPGSYGNNFGFNHPGFNVVSNPWNAGWNNSWGIGNGFNAWNTWGYGGNLYGNRLGWNSPFYTLIAYTNPKVSPATYTSGSNLGAYKNRTYNTINSNGNDKWGTPSVSGGNNSFGSLVRKVLAPSSNGSSGNYDRPARTFSNSNGSQGTSSSAGGSSGGFKSSGSSASSGRGGRGN